MGARHDFVTRYAALTASDEAAVRHRVQTFIRGGVGPERRDPLYDSDMATWLLGLLASDTHIEAIEVAEQFAKFPCLGVGVKPETKEAQAAFDAPSWYCRTPLSAHFLSPLKPACATQAAEPRQRSKEPPR